MRKALQIVLIVVEFLITLIVLTPLLLWLLLNLYLMNHRIGKNRKRMVKMLRREGLSEHTSIKIAEHMFPKMEFPLSTLMSMMSGDKLGKRKEGRANWKAE
ncbi:MAG: hypothetical protein FGF48_08975 [Candidatus Brockarchaeota archaeon]|nr:hypothetical protein [Candidatus Brockarchaeota archaeon]